MSTKRKLDLCPGNRFLKAYPRLKALAQQLKEKK